MDFLDILEGLEVKQKYFYILFSLNNRNIENYSISEVGNIILLRKTNDINKLINEFPLKDINTNEIDSFSWDELQYEILQLTKNLLDSDYTKIFKSSLFKYFLNGKNDGNVVSNKADNFQSFVKFFNHNVTSFINDGMDELEEKYRAFSLLILSIAYFEYYLQINYTGPQPEDEIVNEYIKLPFFQGYFTDEALSSLLNVDGQKAYNVIKFPHFLILAHSIIQCLSMNEIEIPTIHWWLSRIACIIIIFSSTFRSNNIIRFSSIFNKYH